MNYNDYMSKVQICAERMKRLREERGLTMDELAEEIGMSPCSVYYYEHSKHVPNIVTLIKFAMYFGVSTDYLLGMEQDAEIIAAEIRAMLDNADVAPVVHSEWIWYEEDKYQCKNCGNRTRVDEAMNKPLYSFCPYCGAKMDLKDEQPFYELDK